MSLGKLVTKGEVATPQHQQEKLNREELEFLLRLLKTTPLVGEQVEMFYIMVLKLQNQYTQSIKE